MTERREAWDGFRATTRGEPIRPRTLPTIVTPRSMPGREIGEAVRSGGIERVRRGAYAVTPSTEVADGASRAPADWHARTLMRLAAVRATLREEFVVVGRTAAILLGLWTSGDDARVHIAVPGDPAGHSRGSRVLVRHRFDIPEEAIRVHDGVQVTSIERTAVDCARLGRLRDGLPTVDAALSIGASRAEMERILGGMRGHRGVRAARVAVARARRSGSPFESSCRADFVELGLPMPETLVTFEPDEGAVLELDMAWIELRLGVEAHGKAKYRNGASHEGDDDRATRAAASRLRIVDVRTGQTKLERNTIVMREFQSAWLRRYGEHWRPE